MNTIIDVYELSFNTPASAFAWGRKYSSQLIASKGLYAAEDLMSKLRKKWQITNSVLDKKAYDGVKKSINGYKVLSNKKKRKNLQIKNPITIRHAVVSPSLFLTFGNQFMNKYGLKNLNQKSKIIQRNAPCVYFGCYKQRDVNKIRNNKNPFKILVYGGTDATREGILRQTKNISGLHHVAISEYISNDLKNMGIPHKKIAITPVDHSKFDLRPCPLGSSVYIYNCNESKAKFYGKDLYEKVIKRLSHINFRICGFNSYSREDLIKIYKDSFIGLRLVPHDGLPNTVIELGLLGRKTIHNGGLPSGISYQNIDDICRSIEAEYLKVGKTNYKISELTQNFLENSRDWLSSEYWG